MLGIGCNTYSQTYSKAFLYNNLNTLPFTLNIINNKLYITGLYADTSISGGGVRSFIAKHDINSGIVDTYNTYRPDQYVHFVSPYTNTKPIYLNNKIITVGYSADTSTGFHGYLISFYDTNVTLLHYFIYPTGITSGAITTLTYLNGYYYGSGVKSSYHRPNLIKVDSMGNEIFEKFYVIGSEANTDANISETIIPTDSGDLLIAFNGIKEFEVYPERHNKIFKTILLKVDSVGNEKWRWIDTSNNGQAAYSFQKTNDGGYISCGSYIGNRVLNDTDDQAINVGYIVKWNNIFKKEWEKKFNTASDISVEGELYDIQELADGGFISCGWTASNNNFIGVNGFLVKVDSHGNEIWNRQYQSYQFPYFYSKHYLYDLEESSNGDIIVVGDINPQNGIDIPQQGWLLRVDSNGCIVDSNWCGFNNIEVEPYTSMNKNNELKIFPNPANKMINLTMDEFENLKIRDVKVEVYDAMGRSIQIDVIQKETSSFREMSHQINISKLGSGLYFVRVLNKENKQIGSGKFVKE